MGVLLLLLLGGGEKGIVRRHQLAGALCEQCGLEGLRQGWVVVCTPTTAPCEGVGIHVATSLWVKVGQPTVTTTPPRGLVGPPRELLVTQSLRFTIKEGGVGGDGVEVGVDRVGQCVAHRPHWPNRRHHPTTSQQVHIIPRPLLARGVLMVPHQPLHPPGGLAHASGLEVNTAGVGRVVCGAPGRLEVIRLRHLALLEEAGVVRTLQWERRVMGHWWWGGGDGGWGWPAIGGDGVGCWWLLGCVV